MSTQTVESHLIPCAQAPLRIPLRNILATLTLTVSSLAVVGHVWQGTGYEMLIVAMGWPHVLMGFAFYFGKVLRDETNARISFSLLCLITIAVWIVHYNYAITGLIYLYFLYHAFRDEVFVYLQTRARHRAQMGVFAVAGIGPLILLMLLVPKQQDFRQDMRLVEFRSDVVAANGWTLISFKPVPNSGGHYFYFYLQAPHTTGVRAFTAQATTTDVIANGEVLVGDQPWDKAADLVFRPRYADSPQTPGGSPDYTPDVIPVLLTGGHRVGQTFTAERDGLAGIWLPIKELERQTGPTRFVFHLASPPLLPYSRVLTILRILLIGVLAAWLVLKLLPGKRNNPQLWTYLLVLVSAFAIIQMTLKSTANEGYAVPRIFQFVVIFHYWSWYVFSLHKLRANAGSPTTPTLGGIYELLLWRLRQRPYFIVAVILLNVLSASLVFWYYQLNGPLPLRYGFDYSNFLYILVLHVTFSFNLARGLNLRNSIARPV